MTVNQYENQKRQSLPPKDEQMHGLLMILTAIKKLNTLLGDRSILEFVNPKTGKLDVSRVVNEFGIARVAMNSSEANKPIKELNDELATKKLVEVKPTIFCDVVKAIEEQDNPAEWCKLENDNTHHQLERINKDLEFFIKNSIQNGLQDEKKWSSLFEEPEQHWCWKTLSCKNVGCPVRKLKDYRCWLIAGTLCGGEVQGSFAKKYNDCTQCKVYKQYHIRPIRALYENISTLIAHITNEVDVFHHMVRTDSLTQLLSRNGFEEVIAQEVKRSKRMNSKGLTFVMFDLDNFKKINDEAGHLVGDHYLVEFARLLRKVSRGDEFVCRSGGDEFTVLLVGSRENEMQSYIDRVQKAINDWNAKQVPPEPFIMAASAGEACLSDMDYDIEKCLASADAQMYKNKQERKSRQAKLSLNR